MKLLSIFTMVLLAGSMVITGCGPKEDTGTPDKGGAAKTGGEAVKPPVVDVKPPVVDVNAEMFIRPKANIIADKYRQFARASENQPANGVPADGMAAARNLADPLVKCVVDGRETFMLQSQCPQ